MVMLVLSIIFLVFSLVLFICGAKRCICKKMDDDILGSTNGTGCYFCCDYDRMCYGEGTGHATIHNPQEKNLPGKDTNAGRAPTASGSVDEYDEDEEEEQNTLR